jgi:ATP-dependent Clp protease ATP-binding subunit ClpA
MLDDHPQCSMFFNLCRPQVQLESKPEEIDVLERQLIRLQVEEKALEKEKDKQVGGGWSGWFLGGHPDPDVEHVQLDRCWRRMGGRRTCQLYLPSTYGEASWKRTAQVVTDMFPRRPALQSQERLAEVRRELGELQDKLKPLQMRYQVRASVWAAAKPGARRSAS